jgi:hypothetical protein
MIICRLWARRLADGVPCLSLRIWRSASRSLNPSQEDVMPLFAKTISLYSALPPDALLDRIRALAMGKSPMPRQPRWRSPVRWSLREQPGAIRLMPLSAPDYRAQQPSFIGTIEPEGSGSRLRGRVAPYALTAGITAFLLFMDAAMTTGGVVQEFSRHRPSKALAFALFGIAFGAVAVSMVQLGVKWAAADVRRLLATAASSEADQTIGDSTMQPRTRLSPKLLDDPGFDEIQDSRR